MSEQKRAIPEPPMKSKTATVQRYWVPAESQAEMLAKLMGEKRATQAKLAELLGCHQTNISHVLTGKQRLTAEQIDVLARFFDVPHGSFFGEGKTLSEVNKDE